MEEKDIITKLGSNSIDFFDKDHELFRATTFYNFMKRIKQKYMAKVRFSGDKKFSLAMQRQFLSANFTYGSAGIIHLGKFIDNQLNDVMGIDLTKKYGNASSYVDDRISVGVKGILFDTNNFIIKGRGITAKRHNTGRKSYDVEGKNTAIMLFNYDYETGIYKWLPFAYLFATAETIKKKRLLVLDKKFVANNVNNSYSNEEFKKMYSLAESYIDISPSQSSITGNKADNIDINKMLQGKIAKLDMSNGETISDIMNFIDNNFSQWNYLFGERVNSNKKSDRNITDEFKADEIHFSLMEEEFKDNVNIFMENYEKVFGVKLTAKFKTDIIKKEIESQERALSGGGSDSGKENVETV